MNPVKLISAALLGVTSLAQAIEEPTYAVIKTHDGFEVRRYAAYLVAETVVPGPAEEAGNQGFKILADYIFGNNRGEKKLAMTAPVSQTPVPVKLAMTAPVSQVATPGGFLVQFTMPAGYTLTTLPEPVDPRVKLREIPSTKVVVLRYSGGWSQATYDENLQALRQAVDKAGLATVGEPILSRYNSPFSLPFMRRNEIWLTLR
jgi:hypothetical protein